jgi:hypothetical protein
LFLSMVIATFSLTGTVTSSILALESFANSKKSSSNAIITKLRLTFATSSLPSL